MKTAATQLKEEITNVVNRYAQESDITAYECLGALEVVKANLLDLLAQQKEP